jgi:hypothetical protein
MVYEEASEAVVYIYAGYDQKSYTAQDGQASELPASTQDV